MEQVREAHAVAQRSLPAFTLDGPAPGQTEANVTLGALLEAAERPVDEQVEEDLANRALQEAIAGL